MEQMVAGVLEMGEDKKIFGAESVGQNTLQIESLVWRYSRFDMNFKLILLWTLELEDIRVHFSFSHRAKQIYVL